MSIITHKGVVTSVKSHSVTVKIAPPASDCDGCSVARVCRRSETFELAYPHPSPQMIGKVVTVAISAHSQREAMVYLLVVPLLLLVAGLFIGIQVLGLSSPVACLLILGITALWFIGVYFSRQRFNSGIKIIE